ncbi:MAG: hypothetical protein ACK55I_28990, partial [bacterium]
RRETREVERTGERGRSRHAGQGERARVEGGTRHVRSRHDGDGGRCGRASDGTGEADAARARRQGERLRTVQRGAEGDVRATRGQAHRGRRHGRRARERQPVKAAPRQPVKRRRPREA